MPDALELALANAASNMPKGEELHIENLDSIADPSLDEPDPDYPPYVVVPKPPEYSPSAVAFSSNYQQKMEEEYRSRVAASNATASSIHHLSVLIQAIDSKVNHIIDVIQEAKQSMPQEPSLKHRSLHEWDDQYLINELVERENDLMPFYYELLKRIGSPELQSLVMSSMQGKNNSMVTLAQLCSALGSMVQPQPQHHEPTAQEYPSTVMSRVPPQQAVPQQQYFGQATEEYIRQDYSATIPSMPPTYNPYFKER